MLFVKQEKLFFPQNYPPSRLPVMTIIIFLPDEIEERKNINGCRGMAAVRFLSGLLFFIKCLELILRTVFPVSGLKPL